jgi:RHS repeat-associated protein
MDDAANMITFEEYHPYGTTAYQSHENSSEVSTKRYRYTGKERDEESGLYYHGARYYSAWLGRWCSADPAGLVDGLNLYLYDKANPIKYIDPNGNKADDPGLLGKILGWFSSNEETEASLEVKEAEIEFDSSEIVNLTYKQLPDGTFDFSKEKDDTDSTENILRDENGMIELIQDENSSLYNSGRVLIEKMREIKSEGQVYWFPNDPKKRFTEEQMEELGSRPKRAFVRMGDFSDDTPVGKKGKTLGDFDRLRKAESTTNCSTAVLDALYRTLGGKVNSRGKVIRTGGVDGVPLTDSTFSGFAKKFQGRDFDDAVVDYGLGYKVGMDELKPGDIIGTGSHRMIFLKELPSDKKGRQRIKAIQANLKTGTIAIKKQAFTVKDTWKAVRIFDIRTSHR